MCIAQRTLVSLLKKLESQGMGGVSVPPSQLVPSIDFVHPQYGHSGRFHVRESVALDPGAPARLIWADSLACSSISVKDSSDMQSACVTRTNKLIDAYTVYTYSFLFGGGVFFRGTAQTCVSPFGGFHMVSLFLPTRGFHKFPPPFWGRRFSCPLLLLRLHAGGLDEGAPVAVPVALHFPGACRNKQEKSPGVAQPAISAPKSR